MTKIVLIGAGSVSFGTGTLCDLFAAREELTGSTIALVDINPTSLQLMAQVAQRLNAATGEPFVIQATTDRCSSGSGSSILTSIRATCRRLPPTCRGSRRYHLHRRQAQRALAARLPNPP